VHLRQFTPGFLLLSIGPGLALKRACTESVLGRDISLYMRSKTAILCPIKDKSERTDCLDSRRQEIDTSGRSQR
jgi:hypothetical protein